MIFRIGDEARGTAWTKKYPEREFADYYQAGSLRRLHPSSAQREKRPPPWTIAPPDMQTYENRSARMLSISLWKTKCFTCAWASMPNVEIAWGFDRNISKYRFESFCCGPMSCVFYKMGRARAVPYKGRDPGLDTGWLDEVCIQNRNEDDEQPL